MPLKVNNYLPQLGCLLLFFISAYVPKSTIEKTQNHTYTKSIHMPGVSPTKVRIFFSYSIRENCIILVNV